MRAQVYSDAANDLMEIIEHSDLDMNSKTTIRNAIDVLEQIADQIYYSY